MKVKELIKELEKLDQEREIWIIHDTITAYLPEIYIADDFLAGEYDSGAVIKEGDYYL